MKTHIAEYVSPGHPDRLADAIVESVVDLAVSRDPDALVGVECAVHTDHVFIDGRIAAGHGHCAVAHDEIKALALDVYRAAGYGGRWKPAPEDLRVIQNVCLEPLSDDERAIRNFSDDQNVVSGYACDNPETDYLPPAHFIARHIGQKVDAWRRTLPDKFGPDFKVLVHLAGKKVSDTTSVRRTSVEGQKVEDRRSDVRHSSLVTRHCREAARHCAEGAARLVLTGRGGTFSTGGRFAITQTTLRRIVGEDARYAGRTAQFIVERDGAGGWRVLPPPDPPKNPTYHNGAPLEGPAPLAPGDTLSIGPVKALCKVSLEALDQ